MMLEMPRCELRVTVRPPRLLNRESRQRVGTTGRAEAPRIPEGPLTVLIADVAISLLLSEVPVERNRFTQCAR